MSYLFNLYKFAADKIYITGAVTLNGSSEVFLAHLDSSYQIVGCNFITTILPTFIPVTDFTFENTTLSMTIPTLVIQDWVTKMSNQSFNESGQCLSSIASTTGALTTAYPTTSQITTARLTTAYPTTNQPTTAVLTTAQPTTGQVTTAPLTTQVMTTARLTTAYPTTNQPTTGMLTTAQPTMDQVTMGVLTTSLSITEGMTTARQTTLLPTTGAFTTAPITTSLSTTGLVTTAVETTVYPTSDITTSLVTTGNRPTVVPATTEEFPIDNSKGNTVDPYVLGTMSQEVPTLWPALVGSLGGIIGLGLGGIALWQVRRRCQARPTTSFTESSQPTKSDTLELTDIHIINPPQDDVAAIVLQSAIRGFLVRRELTLLARQQQTLLSPKYSHTFRFHTKDAQEVHVAGDFNRWLDAIDGRITSNHSQWAMQRLSQELWELTVALPIGSYEFKYVINRGERWEKDPHYNNALDQSANSIICIKKPGESMPNQSVEQVAPQAIAAPVHRNL